MTYVPAMCFRRTPEEMRDPALAWQRSDTAFFAAGACHILAWAFVKMHPGNRIVHLKPEEGFPGNHVIATDGLWAFDFWGWTREHELLAATQAAYSKRYPGWSGTQRTITTSLEQFCDENNHRKAEQFPFDPWPRAFAYIKAVEPGPPSLGKAAGRAGS